MEITLVGSGLLGTAIGERLLARGFRLHVWNRRQERAQALVAAGAQLASSPAEAVAAGELEITVLSDGPITAEVLLNQAGTALPGRLVLQVATIAPAESCDLASPCSNAVPATWKPPCWAAGRRLWPAASK